MRLYVYSRSSLLIVKRGIEQGLWQPFNFIFQDSTPGSATNYIVVFRIPKCNSKQNEDCVHAITSVLQEASVFYSRLEISHTIWHIQSITGVNKSVPTDLLQALLPYGTTPSVFNELDNEQLVQDITAYILQGNIVVSNEDTHIATDTRVLNIYGNTDKSN